MNRYPLWLLLGVASGFLWGCNNYLYAAGVYEATEGLLPIGIHSMVYVVSFALAIL